MSNSNIILNQTIANKLIQEDNQILSFKAKVIIFTTNNFSISETNINNLDNFLNEIRDGHCLPLSSIDTYGRSDIEPTDYKNIEVDKGDVGFITELFLGALTISRLNSVLNLYSGFVLIDNKNMFRGYRDENGNITGFPINGNASVISVGGDDEKPEMARIKIALKDRLFEESSGLVKITDFETQDLKAGYDITLSNLEGTGTKIKLNATTGIDDVALTLINYDGNAATVGGFKVVDSAGNNVAIDGVAAGTAADAGKIIITLNTALTASATYTVSYINSIENDKVYGTSNTFKFDAT